jgi:hypothetical protein
MRIIKLIICFLFIGCMYAFITYTPDVTGIFDIVKDPCYDSYSNHNCIDGFSPVTTYDRVQQGFLNLGMLTIILLLFSLVYIIIDGLFNIYNIETKIENKIEQYKLYQKVKAENKKLKKENADLKSALTLQGGE